MSARSASHKRDASPLQRPWSSQTELVGVTLKLQPQWAGRLSTQYTIGLHAWFLDQVRQANAELSTDLHEGQSEKPFTLSGLSNLAGERVPRLQTDQIYEWTVTALHRPLAAWMADWVQQLPPILELRGIPLKIIGWQISHPATTYSTLSSTLSRRGSQAELPFELSFLSPTSFRRKGHHLPLPVPTQVFQSYLRRWNHFSGQAIDPAAFLDWVDAGVIITRHDLQSMKIATGKQGAVIGFTGAVEFTLSEQAQANTVYCHLLAALVQLAPYCGTGHKTTFGLGQTRPGWLQPHGPELPAMEAILAQRVFELTEHFMAQRQRLGGERALQISETWATILARRELGESLQVIAADLEMSYETVKTYAKLARRSILGSPVR